MKKLLLIAIIGMLFTACSTSKETKEAVPQQTESQTNEIEKILGEAMEQYGKEFFTATEVRDTLIYRTIIKLEDPTKTLVGGKFDEWAQHNQDNSKNPLFTKYTLAKPGSKEAIVNSFYTTLEAQFKSEATKFIDSYRKTMPADKAKQLFIDQCVKNTLDKMKQQLITQFAQLEQKWKM